MRYLKLCALISIVIIKAGIKMLASPTNQQFVEVSLSQAEEFRKRLTYDQWEPPHSDRVTIRFATSWATNPEDVDKLIELL